MTLQHKYSIIMAFATGKESAPSTSCTQPSVSCRHFEFPEILIATENFSESLVIGRGGFGKVYKGNIINGSSMVVAAIKRLDSMSNQGAAEFWAEVEMLSMLRHCNLVSLIGYCNYEKEMILVYEYMPNRTLNDHLHELHTPLFWLQRLNICIGAGRGLHYLHTGTGIHSGVIHRDVKSSNILLHESWAAKISDFGLSKVGPTNQPSTYVNTLIKGTFGYLDPDYFTTGRLTRKSDVYAFGVVLLEVLSRKRAVDKSLDVGLVTWAQDFIKEGNLKHITDSDIRREISPKCLKDFVRIAEKCLHNNPKQRPTMAEVVVRLESVLVLQEKFNYSLQAPGKTILGKLVDMFTFSSFKEIFVQGDSKLARVKEFGFDELEKATKNFSPNLLLGEGGSGKVFLGWVDQDTIAPSKHGVGMSVAVKRLNQEGFQGYAEWMASLNFIGQLAHPNIIRLLGCCSQKHKPMLVYEYMPNKTFNHFLFSDNPHVAKPLSWETRLWIMIGVARGLTYLHLRKVTHRNLKSNKILLDKDFNAKIGGFGFADYGHATKETKVHTRIVGTYGYLDPECFITGQLSMKSDIYSFGVVLLESIAGRRALNFNPSNDNHNLVEWAIGIQSDEGNVQEIIDPRLEGNYPPQAASECAAVALRCIAVESKDRPSIEEVLQSLEKIYAGSVQVMEGKL